MPELPEVESTSKKIEKHLSGFKVKSVHVHWNKTSALVDEKTFHHILKDFRLFSTSRRGKYCNLEFRKKDKASIFVLIHLRMSGRIDIHSPKDELGKHHRMEIVFEKKKILRLHDVRKFARVYLTESPDEIFSKLGPEPLAQNFHAQDLLEILKQTKRTIKTLLLDQKQIAGLGNIYVDESLWESGISPLRPASSLSKKETERLYRSIRRILRKAIELNGTDFGDHVVEAGGFNPRVYGRTHKGCPRCPSKIERIVLAQRGTHFCPSCQS